jgi:hypothetical protein
MTPTTNKGPERLAWLIRTANIANVEDRGLTAFLPVEPFGSTRVSDWNVMIDIKP